MSSKTEYFSRVVEVSEDKKDRSGNSYRTIRIECTPAVQRQNPFTKGVGGWAKKETRLF